MNTKHETIAIADIDGSPAVQVRAALNQDVINEYAELMLAEVDFPPIQVVWDGFAIYWIADGWHRYAAAAKSGATQIEAEIVGEGSQRDALLFAATKANRTHGLRRNNADKRRAVEIMLRDPEWSQWSDRRIAEECGVSHELVGSVRRELAPADDEAEFNQLSDSDSCDPPAEPAKRVGKDGKARKAPTPKAGPTKAKAAPVKEQPKPVKEQPKKNGAQTIDPKKMAACKDSWKRFVRLLDELGLMSRVELHCEAISRDLDRVWKDA